MKLSEKTCIPCKKGTPPLQGENLAKLYSELKKGWVLCGEHHLEKEFVFPNFLKALAFTNKVGEIAEQENHHPDIFLSWGKVKLQIWTHKIDGLSENDFILASKCDQILQELTVKETPRQE